MTSLEDPTKMIAEPAGYFMAPVDEERIGDVSNVLFPMVGLPMKTGKCTYTMLRPIRVCTLPNRQ